MSSTPVVLELKNNNILAIVWDRINGSMFITPSGTEFPINTTPKETFYRTDEKVFYRRNDVNNTWIPVSVAPELTLSSDPEDLSWALATDGTRTMTGSLDMGYNEISNVTTINSVNVVDHVTDTDNPHTTTATQVGLSQVTNNAQLKRSAGDFNTFQTKTTPIADDYVLIEDSEDFNNKKSVLLGSLPGSSSSVFGTNFFEYSSENETTTTSTSWQDKTTTTTPSLIGKHRISCFFELKCVSANKIIEGRLYDVTDNVELCLSELRPSLANLYQSTQCFAYITFTGTAKTFKIQFRSPNLSLTTIRRARIEIWKVSD